MHEWLEGLQKSAVKTSAGVGQEDVRRAETESGVPVPEELAVLWRTFDGGTFQGDVVLFSLHGPEGEPSVLEKTRLKLEGLPAAGIWRIGTKGLHRHLFAARKSALVEQAEEPLPGWTEALSGESWLYGTWDTEARELRLYRSFQLMLEVLVPPKEVEEFGDRTYAQALSMVQGALSDLSVEDEAGETAPARADEVEKEEAEEDVARARVDEDVEEDEADEEALARTDEEEESVLAEDEAEAILSDTDEAEEEDTEANKALSQPVVAAARRRTVKLQKPEPEAPARKPARKAPEQQPPPPAKKAPAKKAPAKKAAAKKAPAKKAATKKAPAKKAATKKVAVKKGAAKKAATKKATVKKGAAKKAPARKAAKKAAVKKGAAKKAPARKAAKKALGKRGGARGRR